MTAAVTDHPFTPLPHAEVEHARQGLRDDADWLSTVQTRVIEYDDGSRQTFTAPPPLTMVEQELAASGAPAGNFVPHSKPPAGIDALTLLAAIDNLTCRPPNRDRAQWVWEVAQSMAGSAPGVVVDAAKTVSTWRTSTQNLLDPKRRFRLRGQRCPGCKAEKVWEREGQRDAAGERHARPALEVDPDTGTVHCLCCSESWSPELHEHLGAVLRQQQVETLAAGDFDPTITARTVSEASVARLAELTEQGRHLAAVPDHAPRMSVGIADGVTEVAPVQCSKRVAVIEDGEPKRRDGRVVDQRCPALLDADGGCYLAERHRDLARPDIMPEAER